MSEHKDNVPELRFPGFTGAWEERKLGDVTTKIGSGKTPKGGNCSYVSKGVPLIRSQNIYDNCVHSDNVVYISPETDEDMKNSRVKRNDVLLNITGASIGRSAVYKHSDTANVNQHVCIIRPDASVEADFIQLNLSSSKGQKEIDLNQAGGGREGLNFQQISKMSFFYPQKQEQRVVSRFFKQLDHLIILHQSKLNRIKNLKAGLLQKMFPKKGEDIPEIRLPEFNDAWEQRELSEIAKFTKGSGYTKNDVRDVGLPIILYGRLYTNYEVIIKDVDTFVDMKENSVISLGSEVIVPSSGESAEDISRASVVSKPGIILGGDLNIITPNELIDPVFLALAISNGEANRDMIKRAQGKSVVHLSNSDLQKINLMFPHIQEQRRIVELHSQLDTLISLHQLKLEHLKEQKKALLQQMFV